MRELALNLMDLLQNSIAAGASSIFVELRKYADSDLLLLRVADNGRGMSPEQAEKAASPFFTTRTTRDVGLGLPLLKAEAQRTGGGLSVRSRLGQGTVVEAWFHPSHIDMVPLGDLEGTVKLLAVCNPEIAFSFSQSRGKAREKAEHESCDHNGKERESMKSLTELQAVKERTKGSLNLRENAEAGTRVLVGMATCGIAAGAKPVLAAFVEEAARQGLTDVVITQTGCMGLCQYEPTVEVTTPDGTKTLYGNMTPEKAAKVVKDHLIGGQAVAEYTIGAK